MKSKYTAKSGGIITLCLSNIATDFEVETSTM